MTTKAYNDGMRRQKLLEKINRSSTKLLSLEDPRDTFSLIIEEAKHIVGAISGSIFLFKGKKLNRVYFSDPNLEKINPSLKNLTFVSYVNQEPLQLKSQDLNGIRPEVVSLGIKSVVLIPLYFGQKPLGVVSLHLEDNEKLTSHEVNLLKLFGSLTSLAISRMQLFTKQQRIIRQKEEHMSLEKILEKMDLAVVKFLEPLTAQQTYIQVVNEALKLINGAEGDILLGKATKLERAYSTHPDGLVITPRKKGYTYISFTQKKAFVIHAKDFRNRYSEMITRGIKSTIFIPLSNQGKSIGVLVVRSFKDQEFTDKELFVLKVFGSLASLAIRKAQLYDEVKTALETRDYFISMAAHELRTPLTSVNGYAQLLESKLGNKNSNEGRWIKELASETRRLTSLANELLTINLIKSGGLNFSWQESRISDVVDRVKKNFSFTHPNRTLVFENRLKLGDDKIIADFDKMVQVVGNLVENAAKFSPANTEIKIRLKDRTDSIVIEIIDRGKGIPPKDRRRIFEGFYRGSNRNEEEGMGLGLYLAKYIITSHKGDIRVDPDVKKGTIIEVSLPRINL